MNKRVYIISVLILTVFILLFCQKKAEKPILDSIVPDKGLIGDPIKIKGENLDNATVIFNNISVKILNNSPSEISTVVPPDAKIGVNNVVVKTDGGESNELSFIVVEEPAIIDSLPPAVDKTIPSSNYIDYPVLIYGQFLSGVISVSFNDIEADIYTNNQRVITTTVPEGVTNGSVTIKVRTKKGISTVDFEVQGPPPNGVIPVNFSIVNVPPPNYIPLISNQWSCGLFSEQQNNTFLELNSDENFDENYKITGKYEYHFDITKDYNNLNYVEIVNTETGEVLAGQFSSEFDNPCVYRMILISSLTGMISDCTVDVSEFGGDCEQ